MADAQFPFTSTWAAEETANKNELPRIRAWRARYTRRIVRRGKGDLAVGVRPVRASRGLVVREQEPAKGAEGQQAHVGWKKRKGHAGVGSSARLLSRAEALVYRNGE
jgi:hypothetical protein